MTGDRFGVNVQLVEVTTRATLWGRRAHRGAFRLPERRGPPLNGEGVQSLAHAVVASRWPLRDDEAAVLFDHFYKAIANGETLTRSLRFATARVVAAELPASVWSGLTLYGDGSLVPIEAAPYAGAQVLAALLLLLALTFALRIRR